MNADDLLDVRDLRLENADLQSRVRVLEEAHRELTHIVKQACHFASPQWRKNAMQVVERFDASLAPPAGTPQEKK